MKLPNMSVSAKRTFDDCSRKWWYEYVDRKRHSKPALVTGHNVHDRLENYLKGNEVPDDKYWELAKPGLEHLPTPEEVEQDGWEVEGWLNMPCGPLSLKGKVDIYRWDGETLLVDDHKTTGGNKRSGKPWAYALSAKKLAEHVQPLTYAYAIVHNSEHKTPPATFTARHIYYWTVEPKSKVVEAADIPWESVEKNWAEMVKTAEEMYELLQTRTGAEDVPPPTSQAPCYAYGGCPHAAYCDFAPEKLKPQKENTMANPALAALLSDDPEGASVPLPAAVVPAPPKPAAAPQAAPGEVPRVLYVGCVPAGQYTDFNDVCAPFKAAVCERGGNVEKKFVKPLPYYGIVDYSMGPKMVAAAMFDAVGKANGGASLPPRIVCMNAYDPVLAETVELFTALGYEVVRGLK